MSIHELSVKWAAYLARELEADRKAENRMAFGMELLVGELVKLALVISLSWLLGILPEVLTITLTAGLLRLSSGGEHCSAYYRCLIGGISCFTLLGAAVHFLNPSIGSTTLGLLAAGGVLVSGVTLWRFAPGDTANKPIDTDAEKARFKKWALVTLGIYLVMMTIMMQVPSTRMLVLPMLIGILEQTFTVTPWGYRFIHAIDGLLGNRA